MGEEFNEELVATAMQIIMNAGDARLSVKDALSHAKAFDFTEAENKMEEAKKFIVQAHKSQTEVIQSEANGKKYEYSMLFAHAQDTLMTIMSEIQLAEQMIDILKIISHK
ncbi:MAG: PTS lactose/cellobiose transporter subunit IIA [Lachnospiraceae bacterium]|jgi:PTS system cellobiose-specific IIA component|nr:PTS lactose/cellobiose transporter subunit IIA [Lachnospiraceae bacterium]